MPLKFRCPDCDELLSAHEEMGGAEITCPICFATCEIPRPTHRLKQVKKQPPAPPEDATATEGKTPTAPPPSPSGESPEPDPSPVAEEPEPPPLPEEVGAAEVTAEAEAATAHASPIRLRPREPLTDTELDMTPMVDVTFLLLIFFMITAALGLQKSYELPAPDPSRPSSRAVTLQDLEDDPKYVIVRIDRYDTFHVSAAAWEVEQEAPSKPDLLDKLRRARSGEEQVPTRMLVMASEETTHERVITALDAGTAVGMEDVKLMTMPVDE